jgi:poly-gamma-glutamate capsule biosynthesis protein CapA/YwtB (metallophosphatase superfamily)
VKKLQWMSLLIMLSTSVFATVLYAASAAMLKQTEQNERAVSRTEVESEPLPLLLQPKETTQALTISAAGDVTIGRDESYPYVHSFNYEVAQHGYTFAGKYIRPIFEKDDLTIVNLETTLTTAKAKAQKKFRFKGDPSYTQILRLSGIDAVNLANNHIHDYLQRGYKDTIQNLKRYNIGYFGYEHVYVTTIKGVSVGLLGYEGWENTWVLRQTIARDISKLRKRGVKLVIVSFHWGVERSNYPTRVQFALGHHAVNQGADLVLGHHPHVIQGIEQYKGKFIVYSLGNFMFGGNRNPADKDTFIFQQTFHFKNHELTGKPDIHIIPASISSVKERNNYQPIPLEGAEAQRIMARIKKYSEALARKAPDTKSGASLR